MNKGDFIALMACKMNVTPVAFERYLDDIDRVLLPCNCESDMCLGWQMIRQSDVKFDKTLPEYLREYD